VAQKQTTLGDAIIQSIADGRKAHILHPRRAPPDALTSVPAHADPRVVDLQKLNRPFFGFQSNL